MFERYIFAIKPNPKDLEHYIVHSAQLDDKLINLTKVNEFVVKLESIINSFQWNTVWCEGLSGGYFIPTTDDKTNIPKIIPESDYSPP